MEVWGEDEARLGLKPIVRRVWWVRGLQPTARQRPRYVWLYLLGFVRPETGEVFWWMMPTMDAEIWTQVLTEFAKHTGAGPSKRVALVVDSAGFHTGHDIVVPEGIHLVHQPAYSPQLQPAERLWPLVREALANEVLIDAAHLEERVAHRCRQLDEQRELVRGLTLYHWWPRTEAA